MPVPCKVRIYLVRFVYTLLGLHVPYRTFQAIMSQRNKQPKSKKSSIKMHEESSTMKIEHVALYVSDLEQAREFFTKYFNAQANKLP